MGVKVLSFKEFKNWFKVTGGICPDCAKKLQRRDQLHKQHKAKTLTNDQSGGIIDHEKINSRKFTTCKKVAGSRYHNPGSR